MLPCKLKEHNHLQDLDELKWYANFVRSLGVRRYLEIGSNVGDTFYAVLANAPKGSLGVSIDLDTNLVRHTAQELVNLGSKVYLIPGDSKDPASISEARKLGPYDVVFIDGDHTYEGVKADWDNYHQLAPVVVIHDVMGRDNEFTKDVYRFWQELKTDKKYLEINLSNYQLGYGVIYR